MLGVSAEQVVSYLDEEIFSPFLGEAEVILEIGPGTCSTTFAKSTAC